MTSVSRSYFSIKEISVLEFITLQTFFPSISEGDEVAVDESLFQDMDDLDLADDLDDPDYIPDNNWKDKNKLWTQVSSYSFFFFFIYLVSENDTVKATKI